MNKDKAGGVLRGGNNGLSDVASRIYHFSVVQVVT